METNVLWQFLKSICNNSDWKYAVFWRRKYHQNQTMLIMEEGYCDNLKPKKLIGDDQVKDTQMHISSGCGISGHTFNGCLVEAALSEMACVHYVMGEGLVGEVAYSGIHSWTSSKDILAFENSLPTPELPYEWLPQIEAGVQTIVLVAVAPYGVLQLGSLEVVTEEICLLTHITRQFNAIQNHFPMLCSSNSNSVAQSSSSHESIIQENTDTSAINTATFPVDMLSEIIFDEVAELPTPLIPNMESRIQQFYTDEISLESDDVLLDFIRDLCRDDTDMSFISPTADIKEDEWVINPQDYDSHVGTYDDPSAEIISSHIFKDLLENLCEASYDASADDFGISTASEIWEAQFDLQQQNMDHSWENLLLNTDAFTGDGLSIREASELYRQISNAENLLEAVVASACNEFDKALNSNNDSSEIMTQEYTEPISTFSIECTDSDYLRSNVTSVDDALVSRGSSSNLSSTTSIKTMMDKMIHSHFKKEGYADKKSSGGTKPVLRKTMDKSIDKQKRRPRDRQLIQERLRVLRDLVPNGEKFSIDGLLDRTIKHMMFLRKVSDQSRKLRAYLEVDGEVKIRSSQRKDNSKSGASWTHQVGSEHDVFPVVVEDLDIPGHMLIEMLCNDHDFFLEIAQVLCGLDLTIVKGGMKTRSTSSWAQFVVEVHKGFQRMDVFWPLMQLLQRNPKLISR